MQRHWTPREVLQLRAYAERRFSQAEAAKLMDRSEASIACKASQLSIKFDGPDGAPLLNHNRRMAAWRRELRQICSSP